MPGSTIEYDLGSLADGTWHQYANSIGQSIYVHVESGSKQFNIPDGLEDRAEDTWDPDTSRTWPQWKNQRTGHITLLDPHPPPAQTYLDSPIVTAHLNAIEYTPNPSRILYRRLVNSILHWLFPDQMGFENFVEDFPGFKVCRRGVISDDIVTFAIMVVKEDGDDWKEAEDECRGYCGEFGNQWGSVYGIVAMGLEVRFCLFDRGEWRELSGRLDFCKDVEEVMRLGRDLRENPFLGL